MSKEKKIDHDKILIDMYQKNLTEITDRLKVDILDQLIKLSEKRNDIILKEELVIIRDGVEELRNKRKDEEIKAIGDVMKSLTQSFGKEDDG